MNNIYVSEKGLDINFSLIFDPTINLKNLMDKMKNNEEFLKLSVDSKWIKNFAESNQTIF